MGVLDGIIERVHERHQRYDHKIVTLNEVKLDSWSRLTPVLVGSCSAILLNYSARLMDRPAVIAVDGTHETATALARDYLHVKFGGRMDGHHIPPEIQSVPQPFAPYYLRGPHAGLLVYLDLKSAYWTIVRRVGWRCVYRPGVYLGKEGSVADFPWPNHRLARNALVTSCAPGARRIMKDGKLIEEPFRNPLLNYPLLRVVSDTLHAIAIDLIEKFRAICVHTDGYIFASLKDAEDARDFLMAEWGFESSVRAAGVGTVKAPGAWQIGEEKTEIFDVVRLRSDSVISLREIPYRDWLRRSFASLAIYDEEV